jgi:hypothetical protein
MSPVAGCGHHVDLWCAGPNTIYKDCFEAQGFVYNRNSYADIDKRAIQTRVSPLGPTAMERDRIRSRRRRAAA